MFQTLSNSLNDRPTPRAQLKNTSPLNHPSYYSAKAVNIRYEIKRKEAKKEAKIEARKEEMKRKEQTRSKKFNEFLLSSAERSMKNNKTGGKKNKSKKNRKRLW